MGNDSLRPFSWRRRPGSSNKAAGPEVSATHTLCGLRSYVSSLGRYVDDVGMPTVTKPKSGLFYRQRAQPEASNRPALH